MRKKQEKPRTPSASQWLPNHWRRWAVVLLASAAVGLLVCGALSGSHTSTKPGRPVSTSSKLMPWQATPENTPQVDEHHIPAWKVPTPPPVAWTPPQVTEPPNPVATRPPLQNPGGVNGDRPPRQVVGLEHAAAAPPGGLVTQDVMVQPDPAAYQAPKGGPPTIGPVPSGRFGPRRGMRHIPTPRP